MEWDDERVARLKTLWADGYSASQVAADLGGVTRAAVCGKVHRLGLSGRAKPSTGEPRERVRRPRRSRVVFRASKLERAAPELPPFVERDDSAIPIVQRRTLLELTDKTCRWPVGDPQHADFFFCGALPLGELPYCPHHCRISYQPVLSRAEREQQRRVSLVRRETRREAQTQLAAAAAPPARTNAGLCILDAG